MGSIAYIEQAWFSFGANAFLLDQQALSLYISYIIFSFSSFNGLDVWSCGLQVIELQGLGLHSPTRHNHRIYV